MFDSRGLSRPHSAPLALSSLSSKSSGLRRNSVWDIVLEIESRHSPRRSSEGSYTPRSFDIFSRIPSPTLSTQYFAMLPQILSDIDEELGAALYTHLPSSPEDSDQCLTRPVSPELLAMSLAQAVDAAADDAGGLTPLKHVPGEFTPIPNTPIGISQFEFGKRESFNAGVRDLIQHYPDKPIGGQAAEPLSRRETVKSFEINGEEYPITPPRIKVSAPSDASEISTSMDKRPALQSRSNQFSDPFVPPKVPRDSTYGSEHSLPMITAPESPRLPRSNNLSEMSHDGPNDPTQVIDFAHPDPGLPECCISPTNAPRDNEPSLPPMREFGSLQAPIKDSMSHHIPETVRVTGVTTTTIKEIQVPQGAVPLVDGPGPEVGVIPKVPGKPGVPTDITGLATAPVTPKKRAVKAPKIKKANKDKVKHGYRLARRLALRKPFLVLVVGRDLAGPTKMLLRDASKSAGATAGVAQRAADPVTSAAPSPMPIPT